MLKIVDVGLMANHLSAHKAIIKRLETYLHSVQNQQVATILEKQVNTMKNHVKVMNHLLEPSQNMVTLPPMPNGTGMVHSKSINLEMSDQDVAIDAHFTASSMAKENFNSSENMKSPQVKKIHSEMALQQSTIAGMYESLMSQMGWTSHPNATVTEQISVISPQDSIANQELINRHNQIGTQNHLS